MMTSARTPSPGASQQMRQHGLRQSILRQWRRPTSIAADQLPEWVTTQRVGIAEVDPPHRTLQRQGAQLTGKRVADTQRVAWIHPVIFERLDHSAVIEGFSPQ